MISKDEKKRSRICQRGKDLLELELYKPLVVIVQERGALTHHCKSLFESSMGECLSEAQTFAPCLVFLREA